MISYRVELLVLKLISPVIITLLKELSKYIKKQAMDKMREHHQPCLMTLLIQCT